MWEAKYLMKASTIKSEKYFIFISFVILAVLWKLISFVIDSEIIFPSPESTIIRLYDLVITRDFSLILLSSLTRGLIGFIISLLLGISFGFFSGFNRYFNRMFEPFLIIIRSTPVMSIILIALIWFRSTNVPIFASFLVSFPIICLNVTEGIKNIDIKLIQMSKVYNIRRWRVAKEIYFPSILPFLLAGLSTAAGIGWKAVIAAEVLSQPDFALGTSMQVSRIYLETESVFAWTIVAIIISFFSERIIRRFEKLIVRWK